MTTGPDQPPSDVPTGAPGPATAEATMTATGSDRALPETTKPEPIVCEPGLVIDERYRLVQRLGKGGMGEVWEAQHIVLGQSRAIKLLRGEGMRTENAMQRFLREAQLVSRIEHPNVIEVSDYGHLGDGSPYLVMELLPGDSLFSVIRSDAPLPWPRALTLAQQIASGLGAAHRAGVIHRDLKPGNIIVVRKPADGDEERVKVIDFGIAKKMAIDTRVAKLTASGSLFGTPAYMAPEQASGEPLDARTDIYALGCVLFEMLTGRRPFPGKMYEAIQGHLFAPVPSLELEAGPPQLDQVVARCLAKAPGERFATMDDLANELGKFVGAPARRTLAAGHVPAPPRGHSAPIVVEPGGTELMPAVAVGPSSPSRGPAVFGVAALVAAVGVGAVLLLARGPAEAPREEVPSAVPNPAAPVSVHEAAPASPPATPAEPVEAAEVAAPAASRLDVGSPEIQDPFTPEETKPERRPRRRPPRPPPEPVQAEPKAKPAEAEAQPESKSKIPPKKDEIFDLSKMTG